MEKSEEEARLNLKRAREAAEMSPSDLALVVGHSSSAYLDLENCDGELYDNIDLGNLAKLCSTLGLQPHQLFDSEALPGTIPPHTLCQKIRDHLGRKRISVSEFSHRVNYDTQPALLDSNDVLNWNIDCLRNVCAELGLNWIEALPV